MTKTTRAARQWLCATGAALALSVALAGAAQAQLSTATLNGHITEDAAARAGATITATQVDTGFVVRGVSGPAGQYVLSGLRPGRYHVVATAPDGHMAAQTLDIQVGQYATLDLAVATGVSEVVVAARPPQPARETKTAAAATNVTTQQLQDIPQNTRNFLNFADLAPGVRVSSNPLRQTFNGGANGSSNGSDLGAGEVNVFIDGVSLKSNVQQGGVVGQDASRGNPFGQDTIQEFRVDTQNYKAEYELAGTAIITAVTRSGGNEFHGDVFGTFENQNLAATNFADRTLHIPKEKFRDLDYGATVSGPIIHDKLFFILSYEGNDQQKFGTVVPGGSPDLIAALPFNPAKYEGSFASPFHEDQFFGKLTWQVMENNVLDLSAHYETDHEIVGFGGQGAAQSTSFEQAQNNKNHELTVTLKDTWRGDDWLNEFTGDILASTVNPSIENPNVPGQVFGAFQGPVLTIGGYSTAQKETERDITLRDNFTYSGFHWAGSHVFKAGVKVSFDHFTAEGGPDTNPQFLYNDLPGPPLFETFAVPFQATYGVGNPHIAADDVQFGVFAQDDWTVNRHLTINYGLRWDFESNANNNSFVTPANGVTALNYLESVLAPQPGNFFNASDYISTGHNRSAYLGEFQPRVGVSYDIFGDQKTVLFAGAGRYYDRNLFRNAVEESLFTQFVSRIFLFSPNGGLVNGNETIKWNPSYLSAAGLNSLIASQIAPEGQLRVLQNNAPPPYTDQFDFGIRQRFGPWSASITYAIQRGHNGIGYFHANTDVARDANGFLTTIPVPFYGDIEASDSHGRTHYDALYVTIDKPYTHASHWGLDIAYTYAHSKQNGNEGLFNYDFPNIAASGLVANDADIHDQLVVTGTADLIWGFRTSGKFLLTSGEPYQVTDARCSFGELSPTCKLSIGDFKHNPGFAQLDLALIKDITTFHGQKLELRLDLFNVFNKTNMGCADSFEGSPGNPNPDFMHTTCQIGIPRTLQLGARYAF
ncbi:MAG TPA: carboxypeptidase regulatory-like domain-containing protein [Caulobacteraceae bacterium]